MMHTANEDGSSSSTKAEMAAYGGVRHKQTGCYLVVVYHEIARKNKVWWMAVSQTHSSIHPVLYAAIDQFTHGQCSVLKYSSAVISINVQSLETPQGFVFCHLEHLTWKGNCSLWHLF